jgi:hypothetical protein
MKRNAARARQPYPAAINSPNAPAWDHLRNLSAPRPPQFQPSMWVKLHNPPTAFSFDEAWLLCETSNQQWLAWIPDYGEIMLKADEFSLAA